jgi:hypothetical protein
MSKFEWRTEDRDPSTEGELIQQLESDGPLALPIRPIPGASNVG